MAAGERTIALLLEYDGAQFSGSQAQADARTVQVVFEHAWLRVTGEACRIALAGRTDAGVHARGQVASLHSATRHTPDTLVRALNAHLPDDLAVRAARDVDARFHARHSAVRRDYRYLVDNGAVRSALLRGRAAHVTRPLDVAMMDLALSDLRGSHDFAALSDTPQAGTTLRNVLDTSVRGGDLGGQPVVVIAIGANAFLRHMVRNIVGALIGVGHGRAGRAGLIDALEDRERRRTRLLAPAHGLYLMSVTYLGGDLWDVPRGDDEGVRPPYDAFGRERVQ